MFWYGRIDLYVELVHAPPDELVHICARVFINVKLNIRCALSSEEN